jgi:hypothetical protein
MSDCPNSTQCMLAVLLAYVRWDEALQRYSVYLFVGTSGSFCEVNEIFCLFLSRGYGVVGVLFNWSFAPFFAFFCMCSTSLSS